MGDNANELGHIGVLMGGDSSEREISFKSGKAILKALEKIGCQVSALEIDSTEEQEICSLIEKQNIDVVFIALHGGAGEDGGVQAILDSHNIIYTGSDAKASQLAMNKVLTQNLLKQNNISVPDFIIISDKDADAANNILDCLQSFPIVVKPASEGSSIGITIVREKEHLTQALKHAFQYGNDVLVERYILGREITAGILGVEALPLVEIRPKNPFFDFTAKYQKGMSDYIVPAQVSAEITKRVQKIAVDAYNILNCSDFSRVDFIVDQQGNPFFLEINTIPGFTATSLLPMAAKEAGYEFPDLCLKIVRLAAERQRANH